MKCHCWRQRVKAVCFIGNNDMIDKHTVFIFLHVNKCGFWKSEVAYFNFRRGRWRRKKKNSSQIKYHTELIWSLLSGCLCPGEMKSACPLFAALWQLLRHWQSANERSALLNSCRSSPSRRVQASSYSAVIKGPPIKVNTTSWWWWGGGGWWLHMIM